jgi:hypothetical protein
MRKNLAISRAHLRRLAGDDAAVALIEFAFSLPFLLLMGLGGIETANYAVTHMRVTQIAVSLADNASRAKQDVATGAPKIRELDVNEAFTAAQLQAGNLDMAKHGRIILSSLETNSSGGQWIHWQRCMGSAPYASSYGVEGDGQTGKSLTGMGPAGSKVAAEKGFAIMFAEVVYDYQPIIFGYLVPKAPIRKIAAMYVRDDRDLTEISNPSPVAPQQKCLP